MGPDRGEQDRRAGDRLIVAALHELARTMPENMRRELGNAMRDAVAQGMREALSDEQVDRLLGVALEKLQGRALNAASRTIFDAIKALAGRALQIIGVLTLAYSLGGFAAFKSALAWIMK